MISQATDSASGPGKRSPADRAAGRSRAAQGDGAVRHHVASGDAALARQAQPRPDPAGARRRGGDLGAGALRSRRPARAGRPARARSIVDRPAPRRARADARRASGSSAPYASGEPPGSRSGSAPSSPKRPAGDRGGDRAAARAARREPVSSVALALRARTFRSLRRHHNYRLFFAGPDRLARGLVDAERRPRVARALALSLAARRRDAAVLPVRPVHALRAVRRLGRRSAGHAPARRLDAGRGDDRLRRARSRDADRHRDAAHRLRARDARRVHTRARCTGAAVAHVRDGRPARAAERGCAQLRPAQRLSRRSAPRSPAC